MTIKQIADRLENARTWYEVRWIEADLRALDGKTVLPVEVVNKLEWCIPAASEATGGVPSCPICGGWNPNVTPKGGWVGREARRGHRADCALAEEIKRTK